MFYLTWSSSDPLCDEHHDMLRSYDLNHIWLSLYNTKILEQKQYQAVCPIQLHQP